VYRVDRSKTSFFRELTLLSGLEKPELDPIVTAAQRVGLNRSEAIFCPGDAAGHAYWVASGMVKVGVEIARGRDLTLHLYGKGQFFGEGALFAPDAPRYARATAHGKAAVWAVPRDVFAPMLAIPEHAARLGRLIEDRRQRVERRLALLQREVIARVAGVLLDVAEEAGVRDSRGVILALRLTHRELAGLVGATRETVGVVLQELRRSRLVQVEERRLVLVDTQGLRALAENERRE
jgi:CRP/FNR family transcriptional regulator, cyclic AMP receptor protein